MLISANGLLPNGAWSFFEIAMGIEFQIYTSAGRDAIVRAIAELPFARPARDDASFDLGDADEKGWAEATVYVNESGVWFVDHCGGEGRNLMAQTVGMLTASFGPVTVEEQ